MDPSKTGSYATLNYTYVGTTPLLSREATAGGGAQSYEYTAAGQRLGRLRATTSAATPQWRAYETDAQGSVVGLEDPTTGRVSTTSDPTNPQADYYDTDPYGNAVDPNEGHLTPDARANPFRFQGFYRDQATGNYDEQARIYRPGLNQFLQEDRFADPRADITLAADPLTASRYGFVGGNPATRNEFDGHQTPDRSGGV